MTWQNKVFFTWFISFSISILVSITTQHTLAINCSFVLLACLGVIMGSDLTRDLYFSIKSKHWPTAASMIKSHNINYSAGGSKTPKGYWASFEIEYSVYGEQYQYKFKNPNPGMHNTREEAQEYANKVITGEVFPSIYYNPQKPEQSYIDPGLKIHHALGIPIGLAFIIVPILTITGYIKW